MGLFKYLKKANDKLTDINDTLTAANRLLGLEDEKSDKQQLESGHAETVKQLKTVEKPIPAPRIFDKDGREIRTDLRIK